MGKSESQMDIVEKSSKAGKRRWSVAEIGLTVLLLLVSCALAGLAVLYTSAMKEPAYRASVNNVCTTPGCVTAAARLIQNMDPRVEPCQNFYQYACGGWLERHVIPETSSRYSVFDILRDELEIILKGVLETANEQDREAFQKAKTLYISCMNESLIEKRDSQPLMKLIDVIGGWPVASEDWDSMIEDKWSLEDILATLNSHFHKKVLVDLFVWTDDRDSSRHIIYIDQPGLGMPSRDYYFNDGNYKRVREAYLEFMVSIARMAREDRNLTRDEEQVWEEMRGVMELETDIANATSPVEERHDVTLLYHKMALREVQEQFGLNGFNWTRFVQGVLSSVNIEVQPQEEVVVYGAPYLQKLKDVLAKHSTRTLQNYLTWQLVMERVSSLSRRFKDARAHYRKALYGTTVEEARWRDCVRYVQSNMENAVGALYVRETFAGESKRMVRELISKIQEAFVETLEELRWMDEQSKQKARDKAMAIKEQIGYPDHILEEKNLKLDQEYAHLNFSEENYFENILENLHAGAQKSLRKLRERVDPDLWIIGAAVVNAFYSPNRNQIVFPAGILQPPFFSQQQPQALNFGGIGMVIGHEITHGFDDNGRNFDKDGNMFDWWSNYSAMHFKEQSQCMVYQYGNFTWKLAGGQNVSGISTLGENIADNGGVRQAYKAYLKWVEREGEEPRLPGLDLDHKQLFFLNFAQVWCGSYRPEYASQSIKTDSHSPLEYRVMGSLQNFGAFSEAFHCQKGSPMDPEVKCRVW
ncbi:membrane metallo-endopeptidase-like 1 isoform X2 [Lepisosteus oculatus]|nr:PREDICTED: membrane metallo-endopeptidase-like 1 isoform X2 [Lepisosteus oculatus]XP_015192600.1 PREDICTED: membrane metallo-endopeptidase-like 1 isoform X2 [Lepisosteus oculatus]XP_015192601.1 PREDICTED: membrane metallo-endopeptidase-like 1 isoform X2 [Lepisosteus oculatus]XP_015192602.1 PREDICTED: membrane metallo-endopeptidase-like 1 isoform X2 [Lepisosteus oculatus]XP_015192603.1 PREDICTED: membrane metallo-endopeptidase-like 1 isoform X2 [Lepisosteus oculatus]